MISLASWKVSRCLRSVLSGWNKTHNCGYDADTMVNNVFAYGLDGKVFFAAINLPGSWAGGALTAQILASIRSRMVHTKFVYIKVFHAAATRMEFWSGQ